MSGRRQQACAAEGSTGIKVVLFDLVRTLLMPAPSFAEQLARIYWEVAGLRVTPRCALQVTEAHHRRASRHRGDPAKRWQRLNRAILAELAGVSVREISPTVAAQVRPRLRERQVQPAADYQVPESRRRLVQAVAIRAPLGLASTETRAFVDGMLDRFGLRALFKANWIFTSDSIRRDGQFVHKPTAEFSGLVRARTGVAHPRAIALVGDHLHTDALYRFGHPVVLLDACGHQLPYAPDHPLLRVCRSTTQAQAALHQFGLPRRR